MLVRQEKLIGWGSSSDASAQGPTGDAFVIEVTVKKVGSVMPMPPYFLRIFLFLRLAVNQGVEDS